MARGPRRPLARARFRQGRVRAGGGDGETASRRALNRQPPRATRAQAHVANDINRQPNWASLAKTGAIRSSDSS